MTTLDRWNELAPALGIDATSSTSAYAGFKMTPPRSLGVKPREDQLRPCRDGERTAQLVRLAGMLLQRGFGLQDTTAICLGWNIRNEPPLPDAKILATCDSIARSDTRNHPDRYVAANDANFDEPWFDPEEARVVRYLTAPPPEREWLLQGLLPKGIVGMISAPGGSSKSQLLLQLAYAVAQRSFFLGRWQVGTPGAVLMLCAEDEEPEIHRRLHRLHRKSGGLDSGLRENLYVRSTVGERTLLTETGQSGEVDRTALVHRLAATAALIPNLQLIVIDPVSRFRGGEENSNEDTTRFIEALEFLAQRTRATVLVAHHSNKASLTSGEATQNSARGASALTDGARWHLSLSRPAKDHPIIRMLGDEARSTHVEMTLVKTNYTAPMAPVLLRRDDSGLLSCSAGHSVGEQELVQIAQLLRVVQSSPGVTRRQLETLIFGKDKRLGISEKAGRELVSQAVGGGYLTGNARSPLSVTERGAELLKHTVPQRRAGAARHGEPPREKP